MYKSSSPPLRSSHASLTFSHLFLEGLLSLVKGERCHPCDQIHDPATVHGEEDKEVVLEDEVDDDTGQLHEGNGGRKPRVLELVGL